MSKPKRRTRRSRLTKEKTQELFNALAAGNTQETAAKLCDISESTFYYWKKRGREAKSGIHREFYEAMEKAEALAEARRVQVIQQAMEGKGAFKNADWKAAAWYLERRYPEKWGRNHMTAEVNHSGEVTQRHENETRIEIVQKLEADPEAQELLEQLYERSRGLNG